MLSQKLKIETAKVVSKYYQMNPAEVEVEPTRDLVHGDLTTNVALKIASRWGVPPKEAAENICQELKNSRLVGQICQQVEVAAPGFINFWIKPALCLKQLNEQKKAHSKYAPYRGQRIIVEFSSPNIAKPMHVGHIRSTIIGAALANIYEALGAKVYRLNHLGDWGTQFGKLIAAYKRWGNRQRLRQAPIEEMLRLYVKFHQEMKTNPELETEGQREFLKLERGDRHNKALWNWFKKESLREFNKLYKRLGVKFSHILGESFYEPMLKGVVTELLRQKLAVKNEDGSIVVHLTAESLPPCLIQKSDGGSLYATRDLAAIRYRLKRFKPHKILYVVGNEQSLHFEQIFAVARLAGWTEGVELQHIKYGLILSEDGQKLATREGRIIPLAQVLDQAHQLALKIVQAKNPSLPAKVKERVAEAVGVGAVKYNDLSQNRLTDITFNWQKMLSLEGNSAPYLQYTYVRLKSVLKKAAVKITPPSPQALSLANGHDQQVLRMLIRYPEFLRRAAEDNAPHLLAAYLYDLANQVNTFYHAAPVIKAEPLLRSLRLNLVRTAAEIIHQGLAILGIETVERM